MFTYNHSTKTVTEVATMEKPNANDKKYHSVLYGFDRKSYNKDFDTYYAAYISPRTYPAIGFSQEDEKIKHKEAEDFEIRFLNFDRMDSSYWFYVAVRIKSEPSLSAAVNIEGKEAEDYLGWAKMLDIVMDQMLEWKVNNTPSDVASLIKELYSKYQLFKSKP